MSEARICSTLMQHTKKNIRIIRDKLSRIGIGEKKLDDETILESYSINKFGQLCAVPKVIPPVL
ncbi:MAG: hypothetical protein LUQ04_06175 [Methanoregula sp.]|nr:hypothetical protein [Methanoregula sp.]